MNTADAQAALVAAGLGHLAAHIDLLARPSIRLFADPVDESGVSIGMSKLGGLPDLPPGFDWPEWRGLPQSFIAQIRLADLWSTGPDEPVDVLPRQGMLWFFYDARQETYGEALEDEGGWRVFYLEGDLAKLHRATAPAALPAESRFHACALRFARELTFSQQPELEIPGLVWAEGDQERYEQWLWSLRSPAARALPHHRLFGFPDTIQDDMRLQCQRLSQGVREVDNAGFNGVSSGAMDWHLLLQVDSDARAGMRWANAGMLYYWIRQSDLQTRRFDAAWLVLQSE
jgi:uncharacterized protein YwqG